MVSVPGTKRTPEGRSKLLQGKGDYTEHWLGALAGAWFALAGAWYALAGAWFALAGAWFALAEA